ncbi:MAG: hypothetical protein GAK43_02063 [Stenotrophomonas maltophilia]|nr:MAG: hypothetical protein GAK43_02063 [Stenotrophomonas maltophilia]
MEWLMDPTAWLGLLTLILLELVLGIDNLVFIAILADKLPPQLRDRARLIGLSLALLMRLGLLASISWLVTLTAPLVEVLGKSFSGRDLILLGGGLFLLFKATLELHERLEGRSHVVSGKRSYAAFWPVVAQIVVLDAVFSLDAVITAVGMVEQLEVMMIAVIFSIGLMMIASKPLTRFVNAHPTVIMLCLGFLLMIGFSLVAEGLGLHIPKGYLYAAIGFSLLIEMANQLVRWRRQRHLQAERGPRQRTAHAVMRLLGGRVEADEVGEEIADLVGAQSDAKAPFDRRERMMIRSVLALAERSVKSVMVDRSQVQRIDLAEPAEAIRRALLGSSCSRLVVIRDGQIDEPLGYVHKKELLARVLDGESLPIESLLREPLCVPDSSHVLGALERMRQGSTHVAFVVNEFGGFEGLLSLTDILAAIAGELPDASEVNGSGIEREAGGYRVDGGVTLAALAERVGLPAQPTADYQTLGGLALAHLGRLPAKGDALELADWRLEVLEVSERRIGRLRLTPPS